MCIQQKNTNMQSLVDGVLGRINFERTIDFVLLSGIKMSLPVSFQALCGFSPHGLYDRLCLGNFITGKVVVNLTWDRSSLTEVAIDHFFYVDSLTNWFRFQFEKDNGHRMKPAHAFMLLIDEFVSRMDTTKEFQMTIGDQFAALKSSSDQTRVSTDNASTTEIWGMYGRYMLDGCIDSGYLECERGAAYYTTFGYWPLGVTAEEYLMSTKRHVRGGELVTPRSKGYDDYMDMMDRDTTDRERFKTWPPTLLWHGNVTKFDSVQAYVDRVLRSGDWGGSTFNGDLGKATTAQVTSRLFRALDTGNSSLAHDALLKGALAVRSSNLTYVSPRNDAMGLAVNIGMFHLVTLISHARLGSPNVRWAESNRNLLETLRNRGRAHVYTEIEDTIGQMPISPERLNLSRDQLASDGGLKHYDVKVLHGVPTDDGLQMDSKSIIFPDRSIVVKGKRVIVTGPATYIAETVQVCFAYFPLKDVQWILTPVDPHYIAMHGKMFKVTDSEILPQGFAMLLLEKFIPSLRQYRDKLMMIAEYPPSPDFMPYAHDGWTRRYQVCEAARDLMEADWMYYHPQLESPGKQISHRPNKKRNLG
jgi:hypothetical protein